MLILDNSVLKRFFSVPNYDITYYLFFQKGKPRLTIPNKTEEERNACFEGLFSYLEDGGKINRLAFMPRLDRTTVLTPQERLKWIRFSKQHHMLPAYIQPEKCLGKTFVFDLKVSPSLLYLYLCQVRHLEEFPDLVRIALYLDSKGVDPYLAMIAGARIGCINDGHNYVELGCNYWGNNGPSGNGVQVPIRTALALKWFVHDPEKYDKRTHTDEGVDFECSETILSITSKLPTTKVPIKDLDDPRLKRVMATKTIGAAKKLLDNFK